ncbi:MAG: glycosyltransferase [Acidobacteria bacterium]|nr:glycosyltransferase [Acidobacteriota bacterium]
MTKELPTVTVVTPAYNQADFLRDTIESVLSQDYPNIEYIVLDDGSTDDTPKILAEYGDRVRWETHTNMGQTATINKGWSMTSGEIITWLNSDDTYLPGAISKAVEHFQKHPETGVVYGDTMMTDADGTHINKSKSLPPFNYLKFVESWENTIVQPSSFIRRKVLESVGNLDPTYYYFMDWDFWLRVGVYFRIDYINETLSTYRLHAESKTVAQSIKAAPELEYMCKKYFARDDIPEDIRKVQKKAFMNMYFLTAGYYLTGKDKQNAAKMADAAFRKYPIGVFFANWTCEVYSLQIWLESLTQSEIRNGKCR